MKRLSKTLRVVAASLSIPLLSLAEGHACLPGHRLGLCREIAAQGESYLSLVIRIRDKKSIEIIRATVVSGKLIQRNVPASEYLYEVTGGDKTLAVAFLPQDVFIRRAFPTLEAGEKVARAQSVTIVVGVPSFEKVTDCRFSVRFYRIKPGDRVEEIDAGILRRLKAQQRLALQFQISSDKLRAAICNSKKAPNQ